MVEIDAAAARIDSAQPLACASVISLEQLAAGRSDDTVTHCPPGGAIFGIRGSRDNGVLVTVVEIKSETTRRGGVTGAGFVPRGEW